MVITRRIKIETITTNKNDSLIAYNENMEIFTTKVTAQSKLKWNNNEKERKIKRKRTQSNLFILM